MQVGLAFLPSNLIMAALSLGRFGALVMRCGIRWPLLGGLLAALGLAAFALRRSTAASSSTPARHGAPRHRGRPRLHPVLLAAMGGVDQSESGLASGVFNTSFMMGGALGLAVLASLAAAHTGGATSAGAASVAALSDGYRLAFAAGAAFALAAAALATLLPLRPAPTRGAPSP